MFALKFEQAGHEVGNSTFFYDLFDKIVKKNHVCFMILIRFFRTYFVQFTNKTKKCDMIAFHK